MRTVNVCSPMCTLHWRGPAINGVVSTAMKQLKDSENVPTPTLDTIRPVSDDPL